MNDKDIQLVMDREPSLGDAGFGISYTIHKLTPEERDAKLKTEREHLLLQAEQCSAVCDWLKRVDRINSINWKHSSMGWKELYEREVGYVSQGVFIAAAIHAGFKYEKSLGGHGAFFGMSERSYKMICESQTSHV